MISYKRYQELILEVEGGGPPRMKMVMSKALVDTLRRIDSPVATALVGINDDPSSQHVVSFVDVTDDPDLVSFLPSGKVLGMFSDRFHGMGDDFVRKMIDRTKLTSAVEPRDVLWTQDRMVMRIGKLVKKVFRQKFQDRDIESFVNMYRAEMRRCEFDHMEVVRGRKIPGGYDRRAHSEDGGSLGSSCMGFSPSGFFRIYADNPDVVGLLVYQDERGILGRALVWKLTTLDGNPTDRMFMDRIYVCRYGDEQLFKNYAREQGWLYRRSQSFGVQVPVVDGRTGGTTSPKMSVHLKPTDYGNYPYMDTFQIYNSRTGVATNDPREYLADPYYRSRGKGEPFVYSLISVDGDPLETSDVVYSETAKNYIDVKESRWDERLGSWVVEDGDPHSDIYREEEQ